MRRARAPRRCAARRASPPWQRRWLIAPALVLFAAATNYWTGWREGIAHVGANDVRSYELIAGAAPSLPSEAIFALHSQRFGFHYATGIVSDAFGIGLPAAYYIVFAVIVILLLVSVHALLSPYRLGIIAYAFCTALLVWNPYWLRPYAITPGLLQDVSFSLGLTVALLGLTRRVLPLVLVGVAVAVVSRQTTLLVALPVALWLLRGAGWRERSKASRIGAVSAVLGLSVGLYAITSIVAGPFSKELAPMRFPEDTVLPLVASPGELKELAAHLARTAIPLLIPTAVLVALLALGRSSRARIRSLPAEFWASVLIAAAIIVQPLGVNPDYLWLAHGEQRLSVMGLVPLVLAIALLLDRFDAAGMREIGAVRGLALLAALAFGSLHHIFTSVGPESASQFLSIQIAMATIAALILVRSLTVRDVLRSQQVG